ncbi:cilia- and flagella-associated protein [Histomonas meleagridis]|uniref:cilia- and flagella-associated protein 53-like n=1 Tax=Histomonas meleagridis TaxID=135588 RepID=UPI0035598620|nr:cilia- and flagella-associated protein [Histomonas meleagridis]KAH0797912.1 cilia- and flagella-associated protein 53-like [Histomonas meleagridis]
MAMERRSREEAQRNFMISQREEEMTRQRADFESRSKNRYQASELKRRAKKRSEDAEKEINNRRQKLAQLLQKEELQYSAEIQNCVETPQQRRLRLMEKLNALKDQRQKEHDEYVAMKREQAWRDNCDPLRHQISEALQKQVLAERDEQIRERDIARMADDVEEQKYAATVKANAEAYYADLRKEAEIKRQKILQNRDEWLSEMKQHQEKAEKAKQLEYEESLQFRTTTEEAIRQAQIAQEQKAMQQAKRRKELDELNFEQTQRKRILAQKEKEFDVKYSKQAAEELRQQEEDALVERLFRIRKANQNQQLLSTQLNKVATSNHEAELYLESAQEEANRKEDEMRRIDAQKRRQLMLDAVNDRVRTIKLHELQKEELKKDKIKEKEQLEKELEEKRILDQEELETRRRMIRNQNQMLQQQTALRNEAKRREKQKEKEEQMQMIKNWKDEEEKIQRELANPHYIMGGRFRGYR